MKFRSIAAVVFGMFFIYLSARRRTQQPGSRRQGTGCFPKTLSRNVRMHTIIRWIPRQLSLSFHRCFAQMSATAGSRTPQNNSRGSLNVALECATDHGCAVVIFLARQELTPYVLAGTGCVGVLLRPRMRERPFLGGKPGKATFVFLTNP